MRPFARFGTKVQFKKRKNTHGGVIRFIKPALLLITLLRGCFFTIFKLYKCYQIAQSMTNKKFEI